MVNTTDKIADIIKMIEQGDYFVINRPRQYGKTTTLFLLERALKKDNHYLPIDMTFEGIDAPTYKEQKLFLPVFLDLLKKSLAFNKEQELIDFIDSQNAIHDFNGLSNLITALVEKANRNVILLIDEVDKASNNRLFLDFLGMLRAKYLKSSEGKDYTFHSVILAGVHDVKSLKLKIRPEAEAKYNSPWNIAVEFEVDLSFSPKEIESMLNDYSNEQQVSIDIPLLAEKIYYFTSGYPFLVSNLCKIIDEKILPEKQVKEWKTKDLEKAVQLMIKENNTNFESLITNLQNNTALYDFVFNLIMNGTEFFFNVHNPVIHFGTMYGILREDRGKVRVHNRVYEQVIYNFMASELEVAGKGGFDSITANYLDEKKKLNIQKIFLKYRDFMNENYSKKNQEFMERNARLLFLAFIRPIINGRGFDFKEVQVSEEKRLDVVITFDNQRYIIELKIWRGEAYHQSGIRQLCDYLNRQNESSGYLLIYDLRKESGQIGKIETIEAEGKTILAAWV
ncbi:MAG: AAA family ATPase [Candidatus Omnitrophota bacterium]